MWVGFYACWTMRERADYDWACRWATTEIAVRVRQQGVHENDVCGAAIERSPGTLPEWLAASYVLTLFGFDSSRFGPLASRALRCSYEGCSGPATDDGVRLPGGDRRRHFSGAAGQRRRAVVTANGPARRWPPPISGMVGPNTEPGGKGRALTEAVRALQALSFCLQASHERRGLRWLIRVFYCLVTAVTAYCCNRAWQQCS